MSSDPYVPGGCYDRICVGILSIAIKTCRAMRTILNVEAAPDRRLSALEGVGREAAVKFDCIDVCRQIWIGIIIAWTVAIWRIRVVCPRLRADQGEVVIENMGSDIFGGDKGAYLQEHVAHSWSDGSSSVGIAKSIRVIPNGPIEKDRPTNS